MVGEFGVRALVVFKPGHPGVTQLLPTRADARLEVLANLVGDEELRLFRPSITALRQPDFFLTQRLPMRRARVLLVWRAVGDVTVHDDEGWAIGGVRERFE